MTPLHHLVEGPTDAPVVVLSGSLGADLTMWDAQASALAERFRVVRYDHPGHGGSPSRPGPYALDDLGAEVFALHDHLGLERTHWVGLSLGGMVGMWLAAHAPERIDRLTLVCTSAQLGPPEDWTERAAAARRDGTGALAEATVERWLTPEFAEAHPDVADRMKGMVASTDDEGYAGCAEAIRDMDLLPVLGQVRAPTLVIAGLQDPSTPPDHAVRIAAGIPGARIAVLDSARHVPTVERPEAVTELLREHLDGYAPSV